MKRNIAQKVIEYANFKPSYHITDPTSFFWLGHVIFANMLIKEYKPGLLVELGTHYGISFFAFCQAIKQGNIPARAICVDTWQGDLHMGKYGEEVFDCVKTHLDANYASFARQLRCYFDEALPNFADESIDLLHIDGTHTYIGARHDFDMWLPKVKPGGIILFHDVCEIRPAYGVHQLWDEIRSLSDETYLFTHSSGLGVWRKPGGELLESAILNNLFEKDGINAQIIDCIISGAAQADNYSFQRDVMGNSFNALLNSVSELTTARNQEKEQYEASAKNLMEEIGRQEADREKLRESLSASESARQREKEQYEASAKDLMEEIGRQEGDRAELRKSIAYYEAEKKDQQREISQKNSEMDFLRSTRRDLLEELEKTRSEAADNHISLQAVHDSTLETLKNLQTEHAQVKTDLNKMLYSRSWRITKPLRKVGHIIRHSRTWKFIKRLTRGTPADIPAAPIEQIQAPAVFTEPEPIHPPKIEYEDEIILPIATTIKLIAFYLPQFHTFPENDEWWGTGFTEWTNVRRSRPAFPGHIQPEIPHDSIKYYDLSNPDVMRRQAEMAKRHGIYGFCFHHYYFSGKRLMEKPVDMFLENQDIDMPFCLNWANENWTRRWDGYDNDVLIAQNHSPEDDIRFWEDINRYFKDPRYIKIAGRPLFLVYQARLLPDMKATIARWKKWCDLNNEPHPYMVMVQTFGTYDPREYGFDAAVQFPPHMIHWEKFDCKITQPVFGLNPEYSGNIFDYGKGAKNFIDDLSQDFINFPCIFPSWDNTPRRMLKGDMYFGATPYLYEHWLNESIDFIQSNLPLDQQFVFINAWNEWGEGAHLEPSLQIGYAWLNSTSRILHARSISNPDLPIDNKHSLNIMFIGHDSYKAGAQIALLQIIEWIKKRSSAKCHLLLFKDGALRKSYEKVVPTLVCSPENINVEELTAFCGGIPDVIFGNTVPTTIIYDKLKIWNKPFITYVHELEMSLQKYAPHKALVALREESSLILGASQAVCDNLIQNHDISPDICVVANEFIDPERLAVDMDKPQLRGKLGIPADAFVILGMGTQSYRKGIDLFLEVAQKVKAENAFFCWVGTADDTCPENVAELSSKIRNLLMPGAQDNIAEWLHAADMFLLTSREDPFPLVCLEAAMCELPVVCFDNTGGMPDFVRDEAGIVVPLADVDAMASCCDRLRNDALLRTHLGKQAKEKALALHSTKAAMPRLLSLIRKTAGKKPPVSVIVPNYNYARYLDKRLATIENQTYQDFELILLDDASTDNSMEILEKWKIKTDALLVKNDKNTGIVCAQWQKGMDLAQGEYIWMAEADDLCDERFLATMLACFTPEVTLVYTIPHVIDADGKISLIDYRRNYLSFASNDRWERTYLTDGLEEIENAMSIINSIPNVSAAVFRKPEDDKYVIEAQKFRCSGDWMFYLQMAEHGKIVYCHEAVAFHRRHPLSVVNSDQLDRSACVNEEMKRIHDYARAKYNVKSELLDKLDKLCGY